MLGHAHPDKFTQLVCPFLARAVHDDICTQIPIPGCPRSSDNMRAPDIWMLFDNAFNLCRFDAKSSNFELAILSTSQLDRTVLGEFRTIA